MYGGTAGSIVATDDAKLRSLTHQKRRDRCPGPYTCGRIMTLALHMCLSDDRASRELSR